MTEVAEANNMLGQEQFGFRNGCSTSDAVSTLLNNIYKSFNANDYFGAIFIDLRKIFDTISHILLLKKL